MTDTRWAILHKYSASKGFPLWAIKYAPSATLINCGLADKAKDIIDGVLQICFETAHRNPALMTDLIEGLKTLEFELKSWLNNADNFKKGFDTFLKSEPNVAITDEEIPEAFEYIKQNMPGEVGEWREDAVHDQLKNWKLSKITPPTPPVPTPPTPPTPQPGPSPVPTATKVTEAENKVKSLSNIEDARNILLKLIDLGYEDIVNTILE